MDAFPLVEHEADFCVVGGGMAGLCAALAAARRGARVVLMHDRPVLGGNASSECRVHICGADRHNSIRNMRETGLLEEIRLDNLARNPNRNWSVWDALLFEKARWQPNLELLLNCSCLDAETEGGAIRSVRGWQLTTQTRHAVRAALFADCSGDGVLAPLTGAECRMGREARAEYGESIAPERADARTMGMTCLFQAREHDRPQPFDPPAWALRFDRCEDLPYGADGHKWWQMGYWWVELGGEHDSIRDTESLRDELLRTALGVWDHVKNRCPNRAAAACWDLEWLQFLPAKRESRRYVGPHVLSQGDIEAGGRFEDAVAYGGWSMDDHHPAGFAAVRIGAPATVFHPAPSPYGIPYRCLYSRNVRNLMFAGRTASCTHAAMSSTRVMGTGCSMGQAVGTAAAMAARLGACPAELGPRVGELQQALLEDDAYIPGVARRMPELTLAAALEASRGDPEAVRDGVNRPVGDVSHAWTCRPGDHLTYRFARPSSVRRIAVALDSALDTDIQMSYHQRPRGPWAMPGVMPRAFRFEGLAGGTWRTLSETRGNHQRFVSVAVGEQRLEAVRFVLEETWGGDESRVYAFVVD